MIADHIDFECPDLDFYPRRATEHSAGYDLRINLSAHDLKYTLGAGEWRLFQVGVEKVYMPIGFEAQVRTRSGLANKKGITVLNSPGTIDGDYEHPLGVILHNESKIAQVLEHGERVAQLVFARYETAGEIVEAQRVGGFGSTD